mgnify:CR=1 FL=1
MGGRGASIGGAKAQERYRLVPAGAIDGAWQNLGKESRAVKEYKETQKEFVQNLSLRERTFLRLYTEHGDRMMNAMLRSGSISMDFLDKNFGYPKNEKLGALKGIETLQKAMEMSKSINKKSVILYRGTSLAEFHVNSFEELKKLEGSKRRTEGFYSTSTSKGFLNEVMVRVLKPPGTAGIHIESVSHFKREQETLLNHNQKYVVTRVKKGTIETSQGPKEKILVDIVLLK